MISIRESSTKIGLGIFATARIQKGTRIFAESPLFLVSGAQLSTPDPQTLIVQIVGKLSPDKQRAFLSLYNKNRGSNVYPIASTFYTNCITLQSPEDMPSNKAQIYGIFTQASRLNHSCLPNVYHAWNPTTEKEVFHAMRDIAQDEELTISYIDLTVSANRSRLLKSAYNFTCTCKLCAVSPVLQTSTDTTITQIFDLSDDLQNVTRHLTHPSDSLGDCNSMRHLLEELKIQGSYEVDNYYTAFRIAIMHGDQARAKIFATRAYLLAVAYYGDDNPTTGNLLRFLGEPERSNLFGLSKLWEQGPDIKKEGELEAWLWKNARS